MILFTIYNHMWFVMSVHLLILYTHICTYMYVYYMILLYVCVRRTWGNAQHIKNDTNTLDIIYGTAKLKMFAELFRVVILLIYCILESLALSRIRRRRIHFSRRTYSPYIHTCFLYIHIYAHTLTHSFW